MNKCFVCGKEIQNNIKKRKYRQQYVQCHESCDIVYAKTSLQVKAKNLKQYIPEKNEKSIEKILTENEIGDINE